MAKFFYIVRDKKNKKIRGSEEAVNLEEAIAQLQERELIVISILPELKPGAGVFRPEAAVGTRSRLRRYGINADDLVLFCRQLATLLGAGVTILKSLDIISLQVSSRKLFSVIKKLQRDMESGLSLHEAMSRHPRVFSELWVNLVESGEASGNLAMVLNRLAGYLERASSFRKKVVTAVIYPVILLAAGVVALLFLTTKIIPTFAELFRGFNITLPLLTRMLIAVSFFIKRYILFLFGAVIILVYVLSKFIQTKNGRLLFENLKFRLPLFGEFFRCLIVEKFSSEMSTLVESGVPILYCLDITEHSLNNLILADIINRIKVDVRDGKPLSQPLEKSGFFDPLVVQMIAIGEEIGELPQMLKKINSFYEEYIETFLMRFTSMFEPLMLIFLGIVIGIMVIGMFMPIFQIAQIAG